MNTQTHNILKQLHEKFFEVINKKTVYVVYNKKTVQTDQQDFFSSSELEELKSITSNSIFNCILIEDESCFCNMVNTFDGDKILVLNLSRRGSQNNKKLLVTSYCDIRKLPVISSSGYTVNLCRNKVHFERHLIAKTDFGIPTKLICKHEIPNIIDEFENVKVIVKEIQSAGSSSLDSNSVFIFNKTKKLLDIFGERKFIIQPFISGIEIEVPFIIHDNEPIILGAFSIDKGESEIITEKLSNDFDYKINEFDMQPHLNQITSAIKFIINEFYIETYGRVDFIINNDGCFIFDIATTPFFIKHTSFNKGICNNTTYNTIDTLCLLKIAEIYSSPQ